MLYVAVNRTFVETVKPSDSKVEDFIQEIIGSTYEFPDDMMVRVVAVIDDSQNVPGMYLDYDGYCSALASRGETYETVIWADLVNEEAAEEAVAGLQHSGYTCQTPLSLSREAREYALKSRSRDLTDGIIIAFGGICVMAAQEKQRRRTEAVTLRSFQRLGLSSRLFLRMSVCRRVMIMICAIVIGSAIYMMIGEI